MGSNGKESFVLHLEDFEDFEELKDAEAGKLIKAILAYASTGVLPENLGVRASTMFRYIRRHLDRDKARYEETCRKRAESGKLGGRPRKQEDEKQNKAKKAKGFSEKQKNPDIDPDPERDPDPEPEPERDPERDPVAPPGGGPGEGGFEIGSMERENRISYLVTMCRLYQAGAITDAEDYKAWNRELEALRGG